MLDSIEIQSSAPDGRETWKTVVTEEDITVRSCGACSGSADEKVHSSSTGGGCEAAAGAPLLPKSPRREAEGCLGCDGGGFTDC